MKTQKVLDLVYKRNCLSFEKSQAVDSKAIIALLNYCDETLEYLEWQYSITLESNKQASTVYGKAESEKRLNSLTLRLEIINKILTLIEKAVDNA